MTRFVQRFINKWKSYKFRFVPWLMLNFNEKVQDGSYLQEYFTKTIEIFTWYFMLVFYWEAHLYSAFTHL